MSVASAAVARFYSLIGRRCFDERHDPFELMGTELGVWMRRLQLVNREAERMSFVLSRDSLTRLLETIQRQ